MIGNLGKYIPIIFIITFVFIIFDTIISFQELQNIKNYQTIVAHTYQVLVGINQVQRFSAQSNTEQKKYILSGNAGYLNDYHKYLMQMDTILNEIKSSEQGEKNITDFSKSLIQKELLLNTEIGLIQQGNTQLPDTLLHQEDVINQQVNNAAIAITNQDSSTLQQSKMLLDMSTTYMYATIIISGFLTLFLLIFAYLAIMRELRQRTILENKKNEFISLASHELKTPITTMSIFAEILSQSVKKGSRKQAQDILHKMSTQITEMKNLINDLLDVTRIQLGKLEIEKEIILFDALIQETIEEIQPTTEKHTLVYKDDRSVEILGDRQRIWQVLTNLLNNAIKYSPKGGSITITLTKKKRFALVSVQDKGMGISKNNVKNIFDRYFREEGGTEKQFSGLGLGLYLSHEIITLHGGEIWVKSRPGKGSTFYFTVPLVTKRGRA